MDHYDYRTGSVRTPRQEGTPSHWFSKLLALTILLLCVAIGMVGLILPIIPGFLFLMFAALIAARLSPAIEKKLRKYEWFRIYLDKSRQFSSLTVRGKAQLVCWLLIKMLVDAILLIVAAIAWVLRFAFSRPEKARRIE